MSKIAVVKPETDDVKRVEQLKSLRIANKDLYRQVEDEKQRAIVLKDKVSAYVHVSQVLEKDGDKPSKTLKLTEQKLVNEQTMLLSREKNSSAILLA